MIINAAAIIIAIRNTFIRTPHLLNYTTKHLFVKVSDYIFN